MNPIIIPRNTLVVLCGPAGSGKSTWASRHFSETQIVSSDECRALLCDDPANQNVSADAFELMHFIIDRRLMLGRLTVADATSLRREHRRALTRIARHHHFNTAAIVFNTRVEICLERNAARRRRVPEEALMNQYSLLEVTLRSIRKEGFTYVHVLDETRQSEEMVKIGRYVRRQSRQPVP